MGAFYGILTALSIGLADLFGRRVVARRGVMVAATVIQAVAVAVSALMLLVVAGRFHTDDFVIGLVSGIGMGVGLAGYFGGLARASSAVVAPLIAVLSAVIPFSYALGRGADASRWAVIGALIAFAGLLLITTGGAPSRNTRVGLAWGAMAGLGYGFGLSIIQETSEASGAWPALAQRIAACVLMIVVLVRQGPMPLAGVRLVGLASGAAAALSTVFYLLGVQADPTPAVVTASMFPAVTVAVGRVAFHDDVSRRQVYGLGVVLLGVIGVVAA
jgi:drug/metabolite transporter (DMT)-like permease